MDLYSFLPPLNLLKICSKRHLGTEEEEVGGCRVMGEINRMVHEEAHSTSATKVYNPIHYMLTLQYSPKRGDLDA